MNWTNGMYCIPKEFAIGGVYMPPMLIAGVLGFLLAWMVSILLNRFRWSRFFFYPPMIFISMAIIFTVLIGFFIIPF